MAIKAQPNIPSSLGEPAWEVAEFFPCQGEWREADFLGLHTNRMAELVAGKLEVLPMPTWLHQLIVDFLLTQIKKLTAEGHDGVTLFAPLPALLFPGTIREPDILYVRRENLPVDPSGYPSKLDLVMEVVSSGADAHKRDYVDKRADYAKAGIAEYWIVDPEQKLITVLVLEGTNYRVASENRAGDTARSILINGLAISVDHLLALGKRT